MNTRHTILAIIVLIGITSQAYAKRIYIKPASEHTAERQRVQNIISTIGTIVHEIPELNGASFEVNEHFVLVSF